MWERNAEKVMYEYGCYIDWEERFYNCPTCGEPVYECDWTEEDLKHFICPICGETIEED